MNRIVKYSPALAYLSGAFGILVSLILLFYPLFTHYGTDPIVSYSGADYLLGKEFARNVFYIGVFLLLASVAELYALSENSTALLHTITLVTLASTYGGLRHYSGDPGDWGVLLLLFIPVSLGIASLSIFWQSNEELGATKPIGRTVREVDIESFDTWSVVGTVTASIVAGTAFVLVVVGMTSLPNPLGPGAESPAGIVFLTGPKEISLTGAGQFGTAALLLIVSMFLLTLIRDGSLRVFWLVTAVSVFLGASALRYGSATAMASGATAGLLLISATSQTLNRREIL